MTETYPWRHTTTDWADHVGVIGSFTPEDPAPLPVEFAPRWQYEMSVDGWLLTPALVRVDSAYENALPGQLHVAFRFTDPADGWRGGFVTHSPGSEFAAWRLSQYVPRLTVCAFARSRNVQRVPPADAACFRALRSLLTNPGPWWPIMDPHEDAEFDAEEARRDFFTRAVGWADAGAGAAAAIALAKQWLTPTSYNRLHGVKASTSGLLDWLSDGWTLPEIEMWKHTQVLSMTRVDTLRDTYGFTPRTAYEWLARLLPSTDDKGVRAAVAWRAEGWTSQAVREIAKAAVDQGRPGNDYRNLTLLMDPWREVTDAEMASLFIEAGVPLAEATQVLSSGEPLNRPGLRVLAQLRAQTVSLFPFDAPPLRLS